MSRHDLGRIEAIIAQIQSIDADARDKYLERLKSKDPELHAEVLRFIGEVEDGFLEGTSDRIWGSVNPGTDLIGRTIRQYRIEDVVGRGGMGVVYKALDTKLGRHVALKFLPDRLRTDEAARERFMHEAQAVARLDHPNICAIYSVEETETGVPFLAMALYEGETLRERLADGPLSNREAESVLGQTAAGLSAAHAKGLIHRDIKPDNLFITTGGTVKILDFGIAAAKDDESVADDEGMMGTVTYMSPEQARGEAATELSDVWALGAVGYEMVTGKPPFEADNRRATIQRILNEQPDALPPETPRRLERVIGKCLRKDSAKRYAKAGDVGAFLTRSRRIPRLPRRFKLITTMLVAAGLGLGWLLSALSSGIDDLVEPLDGPTIYLSPFNLAPDSQEHDSVAAGMYEDLLISIRNIGNMNVRRAPKDIADQRDFLRDVGAEFLLDGSLFEVSSKTRIELELFSSESDTTILMYENDFVPYNLQADLKAIMERLYVAVNLEQELGTATRGTTSAEAYIEYLLGLNLLKQRTPLELFKAQRNFRRAVELDSTFSEAYAALSLTMALSVSTAYSFLPDPQRFEDARRIADRAIDLDSTNAAAHTALAYVIHERDWEWDAARARFEKALSLNRDDASTYHLFATHLAELKKTEQALQLQEHAIKLEPDVPVYHANYAQLLYLDGQYEEALFYLDEHSDVIGDFFIAGIWRTLCLLELGEVEAAHIAINEASGPQPPMNPLLLAIRGKVFAHYSEERVLTAISAIEDMNVPVLVALLYAEIGEYERALDYLEEGLDQRDVYMTLLYVWPDADPLRDSTRFQQIMEEMDFR